MLQFISLALVAYSYFLIRMQIGKLPQRIPTHFNAAGAANGWGSPDTLWVLFGAQALTCVIFLLVPYFGQRYPGAAHFGSHRLADFPPAQRGRMLAMLNDMAGYLSIAMNLFFAGVLHKFIRAATEPAPHLDLLWPLGLLAVGVSSIMIYYLGKFRSAARAKEYDD
jgi:hypothetical protein